VKIEFKFEGEMFQFFFSSILSSLEIWFLSFLFVFLCFFA
jgi:hypothetical protein